MKKRHLLQFGETIFGKDVFLWRGVVIRNLKNRDHKAAHPIVNMAIGQCMIDRLLDRVLRSGSFLPIVDNPILSTVDERLKNLMKELE